MKSENSEILFLKNHCANFNQTLLGASLGEEDLIISFFKWKRPQLFTTGDNNKIAHSRK